MKILLNGATGGTNFGDFLFAKIFHERVSQLVGEENVYWYESKFCLSDFYKNHLGYTSREYKLKDIDALVCISGGYFCGGDTHLKDYLFRYLRYFHLCMRCIRRKIPIAIIGVEVAKSQSWILDRIQKFILRKADIVIVRNTQSLEQLKRYGVKNPICTADTAHVINENYFRDCVVPDEITNLEGKKLFFHVQPSQIEQAKQMIPAINQFISRHQEYSVVISADQYWGDDSYLTNIAKEIVSTHTVIYHYENPIALCKILDMMDLIITPKLHVGIVGATLSKSVISFSVHTEKIARFYHQLGEANRSLPMKDFSEEKALSLMEQYHTIPICVKPEVIQAAMSNLEHLEKFIKDYMVTGKDE